MQITGQRIYSRQANIFFSRRERSYQKFKLYPIQIAACCIFLFFSILLSCQALTKNKTFLKTTQKIKYFKNIPLYFNPINDVRNLSDYTYKPRYQVKSINNLVIAEFSNIFWNNALPLYNLVHHREPKGGGAKHAPRN